MPYMTDLDIAKVSTAEKTLVIRNDKVYDVTKFVKVHPGGRAVVQALYGKDVTKVMEHGNHKHSKSAYRWMEQYYVAGYCKENQMDAAQANTLSNGVSKQTKHQDLPVFNGNSNESNGTKFDPINWNEPVLWQVGHMGEHYHNWIDDPVDRPLRLFKNDFMEFFSITPWYVVPLFWLPIITMFVYKSYFTFLTSDVYFFSMIQAIRLPIFSIPFLFVLGAFSWTLFEYSLHRWLFHRDPPTTSYFLITLHFLLHGQHHKVPFDNGRLVFPPVAASCIAIIVYMFFRLFFSEPVVYVCLSGLIFGYVCYDLTHYYLHHGSPRRGSYFDRLRAYHVRHHFESPHLGFGISSKLWDYPFNTIIQTSKRRNSN